MLDLEETKRLTSVDGTHDEEPDLKIGQQRISRRPKQLKHYLRPLLWTCSAFLILLFMVSAYHWNTSGHIDQCGTTADEARSKGCIFETTGFSWLPPACIDSEVEQEFLSQGLQFYRDINYTSPATMDEVRQGDGDGFFVTHDYHVTHCALLLKKLHRVYDKEGKVDGLITSLHHTGHCVHMLLDPPEDVWTHPAFAYTKFPYCGRKGGYNVEWERQGEWTD